MSEQSRIDQSSRMATECGGDLTMLGIEAAYEAVSRLYEQARSKCGKKGYTSSSDEGYLNGILESMEAIETMKTSYDR